MKLNAFDKSQVDASTTPDIFDLDAESFSAYIHPISAAATYKALENGLYFSYPADRSQPNRFIHEYKNGKKTIVEIDLNTGLEQIVEQV